MLRIVHPRRYHRGNGALECSNGQRTMDKRVEIEKRELSTRDLDNVTGGLTIFYDEIVIRPHSDGGTASRMVDMGMIGTCPR